MTHAPRLPRSTPEAQGVDSSALAALFRAIDQGVAHPHNLMLLRHGQVIAEGTWAPYDPGDPHMFFSLSKSFTSTAIGLAIDEGRLTVNDRVLSFFEGDAPAEINEHLAAMRVHDLLSMTSGHHEDTLMSMFGRPDGNWAKGFLSQPVTHEPGTHFVYNSGATYMLSAILTRLTGQTLLEYLRPRLFEPLGIANPAWESCPRGINTGGWGLSATIEDIGCFGQLYLQGGSWQGRQLIPSGWIAEATRRQVSNGSAPESDWEQGYGYQFWRCRHNAYRGDGAFGQYCVVLPEQDMVIAMTSGVADMQSVLNIFWRDLLPAVRAAALPEAPQAQRELGQLLSGLSLPPPEGASGAAIAARVSGQRYQIEENDLGISAMAFAFGGEGTTITLEDAQGTHIVVAGDRAWRAGTTTLDARAPRLSPPDRGRVPVPMAASGAWVGESTYTAQIWYTTTPFGLTLTCVFSGDQLTCTPRVHVSFVPDALPTLAGRLAEQKP